MFQDAFSSSYLSGGNAAFVEELYEQYLQDPGSVDAAWRQHFDGLAQAAGGRDVAHGPVVAAFQALGRSRPAAPRQAQEDLPTIERKQVSVLQLINAYRFLGVRHANVDPLGRAEKPYLPELDPAHYGFTAEDMGTTFNTGSLVGPDQLPLRDIIKAVQETYCGTIGAEYMHITDTPQKRWIQARLESVHGRPQFAPEFRRWLLERVTAAEGLERYLHTRFVGQKRFSGEGGESLTPVLDHLLQQAGAKGVQETVIGMAHRGRLNVLVNTLGKMPQDLFAEFEGKHNSALLSGDVKYHQGFSSGVMTPGGLLHLTLAFNPSHLEIVNPVVEGSVRARQHRRGDTEGKQVLPILIHGDAAFAGQGVVMETLNLSGTRGYGTGGTVHVIINNQIGFTTSDPRDTRSTLYCTDVAKMVECPIFHVNGDDPDAVVMVSEIALDFRMQFGRDVVIDIVCYRRQGHNEQDEPLVTQPLMYKKIAKHPSTRKLYAERLEREGVIREGEGEEMVKAYRHTLEAGEHTNKFVIFDYKPAIAVNWQPYIGTEWTIPADTRVPMDELATLARALTTIPPEFKLHSRVDKIIADRKAMGDGRLPLDWGMAENLAYASLLKEGYPVRLSGQDSGRGTFFHRHAVLHDQNRERWDDGTFIPLQHVSEGQADFLVIDSVLSEEAVLGFEYGYATAAPDELVIWEAQFGDFANGAQVVIDQFISSGEAKWGRLCGLVMMLPHGYEGQGPEHSSARLERYLQLCAQYNMQVVVPSTPAQMFHLLRRQMLRAHRKPLIIMTPKSMLRHKESVSSLEDLARGEFQTVIGETGDIDPKKVGRLILCSGKVYFDLLARRRELGATDTAIVRIEQLYPFPHDALQAQVDRYGKATEIMWAQEESGNQGAWHRIQHYLMRHMRPDQVLAYALRPSSAAPAVGYLALHNQQHKELMEAAFGPIAGNAASVVPHATPRKERTARAQTRR